MVPPTHPAYPEQLAQDQALAQIRAEIQAERLDHIREHNDNRTHTVRCTCGLPLRFITER